MGIILNFSVLVIGLFLGVVLLPLLTYAIGLKSLGGVCFSLAQMLNNGTCLFYSASSGYFLHPMRKTESGIYEIFKSGEWVALENDTISLLGGRPFGISYQPDKAAFKNELETRLFSQPAGYKTGESESYNLTGDDMGEMVGIIPKSVSSEIQNETGRKSYIINLRLLVSRLVDSGGFSVANRTIQNELTKSALQALGSGATNSVLLISSLAAVIAGGVLGFLVFF